MSLKRLETLLHTIECSCLLNFRGFICISLIGIGLSVCKRANINASNKQVLPIGKFDISLITGHTKSAGSSDNSEYKSERSLIKKTKFTDAQIASALKQAESRSRIDNICRKMVFP
jgi:hypothetical protein